jgi:flagellar protein FlaG
MAIKPTEGTTGIFLVREAQASAVNTRPSRRPLTRVSESAPAATSAQSAEQDKPPPQAASPSMRIHVDQDTGKTVVSLVNPDSGQVLRQMPSAEALEVAKAIGRYQGLFVNLKV